MISERRKRLFEENPHCCYCGVLTVLTNTVGGQMPPNAATVEHIYPRLHPKRREPNYSQEKRLALACFKCNNEKSVRDQVDYLGKEGARQRSMGDRNWLGWAESVVKDLSRFECF